MCFLSLNNPRGLTGLTALLLSSRLLIMTHWGVAPHIQYTNKQFISDFWLAAGIAVNKGHLAECNEESADVFIRRCQHRHAVNWTAPRPRRPAASEPVLIFVGQDLASCPHSSEWEHYSTAPRCTVTGRDTLLYEPQRTLFRHWVNRQAACSKTQDVRGKESGLLPFSWRHNRKKAS